MLVAVCITFIGCFFFLELTLSAESQRAEVRLSLFETAATMQIQCGNRLGSLSCSSVGVLDGQFPSNGSQLLRMTTYALRAKRHPQ